VLTLTVTTEQKFKKLHTAIAEDCMEAEDTQYADSSQTTCTANFKLTVTRMMKDKQLPGASSITNAHSNPEMNG
jgi:hypothetical protein